MTEIHHHFFVNETTSTWAVDVPAAARRVAWVKRNPDLLIQDLTGMAEYFPRWLLVGAVKGKPLRCEACGTFYVPGGGAICCLQCGRKSPTGQTIELMWLGHIPVLARTEAKFKCCRRRLRQAGFAETSAGEATYLLVPLTVRYPAEWPNVEPLVRYPGRWLDALDIPRSSGRHHLIQNGRACIFSWGQWRAMPVHAVLQQRMVNHIVSLFKIAAGQRPAEAFIGRIHNARWQPER